MSRPKACGASRLADMLSFTGPWRKASRPWKHRHRNPDRPRNVCGSKSLPETTLMALISLPRIGCIVGKTLFEPCHVQHAAFYVHAGKIEVAGFRHTQAVPEHQKQKASVAGVVAADFGGCNQPFNFSDGKVFPLFYGFSQAPQVPCGQ